VQRGTTVPPVLQDSHTGRATPADAQVYGWSDMEAAGP
jgi:hypothetical protein